MAFCKYHPDRTAIGVCVRCRMPICSGCSTRMEGVNHCHACLQRLSQQTRSGTAGQGLAAAGGVCVLVLAWLVLLGLFRVTQGWLAP